MNLCVTELFQKCFNLDCYSSEPDRSVKALLIQSPSLWFLFWVGYWGDWFFYWYSLATRVPLYLVLLDFIYPLTLGRPFVHLVGNQNKAVTFGLDHPTATAVYFKWRYILKTKEDITWIKMYSGKIFKWMESFILFFIFCCISDLSPHNFFCCCVFLWG